MAAAVISTASDASAQAVCGPRAEIVANLAVKYGEALVGLGYVSNVQIIELWHSEATGTWTVLSTNPAGISCLVIAGEGWRAGEMLKGTAL